MTTPTAAIVASATESATSPRVVTYGGTVGKTYLAVCSRSTATDPFTTVTDSGGNTWTRIDYTPKSGSVGRRIEFWKCTPTAAFATVTVAFTGTGTADVSLVEITNTTGVVNAFNSNFAASSTAPASVKATPNKSNTLAISAIQANTNTQAQITTSGGYTELVGGVSTGPQVSILSNPASGTATGPTYTLASAQGSGTVIAIFEEKVVVVTGRKLSKWVSGARVAHKMSRWNGTTRVPMQIR